MGQLLLEGKNAVVSGSSRGIGRATALLLASHGANVLINYVNNKDQADAVVAQIQDLGREAIAFQGNVSETESAQGLMDKALAAWGRVDILVSNAGTGTRFRIDETTDQEWERAIKVNIKSYFNLARAVMPSMINQKSGKIVAISSIVGKTGKAFLSQSATYAGVKAAIVGYTRGLAREGAAYGINVNCIRPGWIDTDATAKAPVEVRERAKQEIPLGRTGRPEDVAGAVLFLVSPYADYITGQAIDVNGGLFMG
jgi:NAD(P)-dependent dehydrogenase (short-subunit alcohol dehydrogenase family)